MFCDRLRCKQQSLIEKRGFRMNLKSSSIKAVVHLLISIGVISAFIIFAFSNKCEASSALSLVYAIGLFLLALLGISAVVGKEKIREIKGLFSHFVKAIKPEEDGIIHSLAKHDNAIYCITFIIAIIIIALIVLVLNRHVIVANF